MASNGLMDFGMPKELPGLFGNVKKTVTEPLFMAGAGLLSGGGWQGAMQGAQMGAGIQEQERESAQRLQRDQNYQSLLAQQTDPRMRSMLTAAGPEQGTKLMLSQMMPNPTDDQREYQMAKRQGYGGSFMDYQTAIKGAGASRTNVTVGQEGKYDQTMGESLAKEYVSAQSAGAKASRDLASLRVMETAAADPNVYTGTGGNTINAVKKGFQSIFGVDVKGVSNAEVISNLASEIAVGNKDKLPGPMSDADRAFLVEMAPNLTKSPEGNRLIIQLGIAGKEWEAIRANVVRDYAAKRGGRLDAGVYTALAEVDAQTTEKFGSILSNLRKMGEMAPRSPSSGVNFDKLRSKYKGLE